MAEIWFEDIEPGAVTMHGAHRVDRDEMVAFARAFDAQPFHLDETSAATTPTGRLIASGWYTCSLQMRMLCDAWLLRAASRGGLGLDECRWLRPVVAGDVLSFRQTIIDKRALASVSSSGLVRIRTETLDQDGHPVMRQTHLVLLAPREAVAWTPRPHPPATSSAGPAYGPEDPSRAPRVFEEIEIGRGVELGAVSFTADDIVAFARRFDPQPFHIDEVAALRGLFGGLAASGWHTASAWMRCFTQRLDRIEAAGGRPRISVSPGFDDLRWSRPVMAGDTIRFTSEPIGKRQLASRPGWGVVSSRNAGWDARGEKIMEFVGSAFWGMRGG